MVGLHGLTFVTIAIFAAPATLWRGPGGALGADDRRRRSRCSRIAGFGAFRLAAPASPTVPGVKLRLMQPDIAQGESFAPENKDAIVRRYLELVRRATAPWTGLDRPGHASHLAGVGVPVHSVAGPAGAGRYRRPCSAPRTTLITGAARVETKVGRDPKYYNSIEIVGRDGLLARALRQAPPRAVWRICPVRGSLGLDGRDPVRSGAGRIHRRRRAAHPACAGFAGRNAADLLRGVFPTEIGDAFSHAERPGWLLNVTDDAWFGLTPGPYQHYAQARLRAIELGLPLVRVANSGVSAVVDGFGREIVAAPLGVEGVLDSDLPVALPPTWQSRFGSLTAAAIGLVLLALTICPKERR